MFPDEETVLMWAKKLFPTAVKLQPTEYLCRFPVVWKVLTASGNCVAIAAASDDDLVPWFMPTGSTEFRFCPVCKEVIVGIAIDGFCSDRCAAKWDPINGCVR